MEAKISPHIKQATKLVCLESKSEGAKKKKERDQDMTYDASYKKKSGTKLHFWNKVTFSQVLWKPKEGDSMLYKVCITKSYFHRYEMNQVSTKSKHFLPQRGKKKRHFDRCKI